MWRRKRKVAELYFSAIGAPVFTRHAEARELTRRNVKRLDGQIGEEPGRLEVVLAIGVAVAAVEDGERTDRTAAARQRHHKLRVGDVPRTSCDPRRPARIRSAVRD